MQVVLHYWEKIGIETPLVPKAARHWKLCGLHVAKLAPPNHFLGETSSMEAIPEALRIRSPRGAQSPRAQGIAAVQQVLQKRRGLRLEAQVQFPS